MQFSTMDLTKFYYNALCSAVRCSAVQCSAVQCNAVQCSAVQCNAVQCSLVQCSGLCHDMRNLLVTTRAWEGRKARGRGGKGLAVREECHQDNVLFELNIPFGVLPSSLKCYTRQVILLCME